MNQVSPPTPSSARSLLTSRSSQPCWPWTVVLGTLIAVLTCWVVGDFSHPLSDGNDTDQYEYVGYFFGKNLHFFPFPHLNLINTQTFYPYGTNQAFLDWGFERDYWYAFCSWLFGGPGPYLQYYYVYSLVVTAVGTFLLLRSRFGAGKSFVAGLIVSIFNVYALWKFPVHMNVCVAHWTALCLIATYSLLLDVLDRKPVSLPFFILWVWLHVQVLSQELAYVAGFALTFTTLVLPVLLVSFFQQFSTISEWPVLAASYMRTEWRQHRWAIIGLTGLVALSLWLYLPLTLQIALTAWQFDFGLVPELPAWSHPARLLLPHLRGLDSFSIPYQQWFHDTFESYGQGSPGLYLTIAAGVGWWQTRHKISQWLPVAGMLVLCLLYHPVLLPTLKLFPWFSFNRHGGRASLIYPVMLVLLALPLRWPSRLPGQLSCALLVALMGLEWYTSYSLRLFIGTNVASDSLLRYCAVVKQQPGEAVLDWPFCTIGANGVGDKEGLCPYYKQQNAVFAYRRFYDKSTVGQYFGRLHPDQIKPFLREGWPQLLTPDRVFTNQDWQFMDSFLRKNKFAGINLYVDLLLPEQVAQFYKRYGQPIAETRFPEAGRVVFLTLDSRK
ncbi:DUF2339 domain-containing protein [Spirosoma pollinicola]|uniref:Glycosyltransferase RgtA/B/C/D-like domain-containing protein n=1 Tax=Spirosoma pollinicola TaxID=2057025 RepID=A0A2K8YZ60_9BACT|nr:hypothetical protein [Spirosoma pollinicola]AUD02838.1 hypothetical protein CWM47_13955 [Spirosoma pollinicola]